LRQLGHYHLKLAAVAVGKRIVGQHPLHGDPVSGVEGAGPAQEPGAGVGLFVGEDLGIGQPGVVIDGGMHIVLARAATPPAVPVTHPMLG
jgi:hypothetical protein